MPRTSHPTGRHQLGRLLPRAGQPTADQLGVEADASRHGRLLLVIVDAGQRGLQRFVRGRERRHLVGRRPVGGGVELRESGRDLPVRLLRIVGDRVSARVAPDTSADPARLG